MINSFATTFETRECKDQQERLFAGESADLVASMTRDGVPLSLTGCTVRGIYQPDSKRGTGEFYGVPAEIVDNRVVVHWTADREGGGNTKYRVWALVEGGEDNVAYPCSWTLSVAYSPSYPVGELPDPLPETIDFSRYNLVNDPWLRVTHLSAGHDEVPQDVDFTGAVTMDGVIIDDMDLKEAVGGIDTNVDTCLDRIGEATGDWDGYTLFELAQGITNQLATVDDAVANPQYGTQAIKRAIGTPPTGQNLVSLIGTPPTGKDLASLIGTPPSSGAVQDRSLFGLLGVPSDQALFPLVESSYTDVMDSLGGLFEMIGQPPTGKNLFTLIGNVDAETGGDYGDLAQLGVDAKGMIDLISVDTEKIHNATYGLAAIRAAIDALAAALPSQVSVVPYVTDNTLTLSLGTVVYRMNPTGTAIAIPTPVTTDLPATDGYYQFEIELAVPATATSLTAPSGWTWLTGFELPSSGYAGKTVYVSCRMDLRGNAVTASCWRVA